MTSLKEKLFAYVNKKYSSTPEYLWMRYPNYAVFRHGDNRKWFALIMDIPANKLGMDSEEITDILNVKMSDPFIADILVLQKGFFRGYHISRGNWISILLDGTVEYEEICKWLDESYIATASKETIRRIRPPKEWLIPANPKYYDIQAAFSKSKEINWKQGKGIKLNDTVFIYVGAPVSAILYKCKVIKTDIPFSYNDEDIHMSRIMKIKLQKHYDPKQFTFDVLKERYGIFAVRGPRGISDSLSKALR